MYSFLKAVLVLMVYFLLKFLLASFRGEKGGNFMMGPGLFLASLLHCCSLHTKDHNEIHPLTTLAKVADNTNGNCTLITIVAGQEMGSCASVDSHDTLQYDTVVSEHDTLQ